MNMITTLTLHHRKIIQCTQYCCSALFTVSYLRKYRLVGTPRVRNEIQGLIIQSGVSPSPDWLKFRPRRPIEIIPQRNTILPPCIHSPTMDPLSVAASVTGLIMAGAQITSLIQRLVDAPSIAQSVEVEISHFVIVLSQLQPFLTGASNSLAHHSRTSLIEVQQIQIILTGSVFTLSELQAAVGSICQGSTNSIGLRDCMKWLLAESTIVQLVQRVRDHKSSLTLILTLLTWYRRASLSPIISADDQSYSKSTSEAMDNVSQLRVLLEHFIQHNTQLFGRVQELEAQFEPPQPRSSAAPSIQSASSNRTSFEQVLLQSDLYRRTVNSGAWSGHGPSGNWSIASGLSLSQVHDICAMPLAVFPAELSNPQCYATAPVTHPGVFGHPPQWGSSAVPVQSTNLQEESLAVWDGTMWELVKSGADKEAVYPGAYPPIQLSGSYIHVMGLNEACKKGAHHTVGICLDRCADVACPNSAGDYPLHVAARHGHHETVKVLLKRGADIEACNPLLERPLHLAALNGHHETVRVLVSLGADSETRTKWGDTPLYLAASHGQLESAAVLVLEGAAMHNVRELEGEPMYVTGDHAIHIAASHGHTEIVVMLLRSGASLEALNRFWRTPLHCAASNGQWEVVVEVLRSGADIDAKSNHGDSPLHLAASNGNRKTIEALLEWGATIEATNMAGYRPLHFAVMSGSCEAATVFLKSGADIEAKNRTGDGPIQLAVDGGKKEIVSLLLELGVLDGCGPVKC